MWVFSLRCWRTVRRKKPRSRNAGRVCARFKPIVSNSCSISCQLSGSAAFFDCDCGERETEIDRGKRMLCLNLHIQNVNLKNKIKLTFKSCCVKLLTAKERISFIKDRNDLPTGKAEKERKDTDYYDNSGSRQKQDV
mgnify:CR=1 FL=1